MLISNLNSKQKYTFNLQERPTGGQSTYININCNFAHIDRAPEGAVDRDRVSPDGAGLLRTSHLLVTGAGLRPATIYIVLS